MTLCRCGASSGGPVLDNRMVSEEEHGPPRGTGIWTLRRMGVCTCHSGNTIRKAFCVVRTESVRQILFCVLLFSYNSQTFCILETFGSVSRAPSTPFLLTFLFFFLALLALPSVPYLVFLARLGTHYSTPPI